MHNENTMFGTVSFTAKDVKKVRPDWSMEQCLTAIEIMDTPLKEQIGDFGMEALDELLDKKEPKMRQD